MVKKPPPLQFRNTERTQFNQPSTRNLLYSLHQHQHRLVAGSRLGNYVGLKHQLYGTGHFVYLGGARRSQMVCLQCAILVSCSILCTVWVGECPLPWQYRGARNRVSSGHCYFHNVDMLDPPLHVPNCGRTSLYQRISLFCSHDCLLGGYDVCYSLHLWPEWVRSPDFFLHMWPFANGIQREEYKTRER